MTTRIVVIGADAAGMSASHQALRAAKAAGRAVHITVLERGEDTSYSACGIPYWIAGDVPDADALIARTAQEHRAAGIDLRTGTTATRVDLAARTVHTDGRSGPVTHQFDELVLATGADPVLPEWARVEHEQDSALVGGVHVVKTLRDGAEWRGEFQDADGAQDVVIVGAGYIAVEMAEVAVRLGHRVTMVVRSRLMRQLDTELGDEVAAALVRAGVVLETGAEVERLEAAEGRVCGIWIGGRMLPADLVVLATGVRPNTALVAAQLAPELVGSSGGLRAEPDGRVTDRLWAAGDCVEVRQRVTGGWQHLPLGTHANKQGRALGDRLGRGSAMYAPGQPALAFPGALGTAVTRFGSGPDALEIGATGLSHEAARAAGIDCVAVTTRGTTASGYMPEARPITLRVCAERGTRRLLGVQVVGGAGAAKRVDAAAAVLHLGGTVDDLAWMDLSYAPPFATAWEVLQVAARRVAERL